EEPPAPAMVGAPWSRRLASSRARIPTGWYAHVRRWCGLALVATLTWLSTLLPAVYGRWVTLLLGIATVGIGYVAIRPIVLPWWGDLRYRRWRGKVLARQREVVARTAQWTARREEFERALERQARPERWAPLKPTTTHRV